MSDWSNIKSSLNSILWDIVRTIEVPSNGNIASEPVADYGSVTRDRFQVSQILKVGFSYDFFDRLSQLMPFSLGDWSIILDMAPKTMNRYKVDNKTFRPLHAEKIIDMAQVTEAGLDFFEDMDDFKRWLKTPSIAFNKQSPMDLLTNGYGRSLVLDQLVRMEHGIFI